MVKISIKMNERNSSLMKTTYSVLLFTLLCLSLLEVTRGDDGHHLKNRDRDNSQVRWWKIVYGGLFDTIKQWISSLFSYKISPEARITSVRIISAYFCIVLNKSYYQELTGFFTTSFCAASQSHFKSYGPFKCECLI